MAFIANKGALVTYKKIWSITVSCHQVF